MKIKFSPNEYLENTTLTVVDENTLKIDEEIYSFPADIVVFDPVGPILSASRLADGTLSLVVLVHYTQVTKGIWETERNDGTYRGSDYEDFEPGDFL